MYGGLREITDLQQAVARVSRDLGDAPVRPASAEAFRRSVAVAVGRAYPGAAVRVETRGSDLAALVPNAERAPAERDPARLFAPPVTGPPVFDEREPNDAPFLADFVTSVSPASSAGIPSPESIRHIPASPRSPAPRASARRTVSAWSVAVWPVATAGQPWRPAASASAP